MTTRTDAERRWSTVVPGLAVLAAVACEQPVPEAVDVVRPVKTLELASGVGATPLEYPAQIAATTDAEIAFEVSGLITELPVNEGQLVREGDLLAQVDPRDFESQLDAVRAERNVARADYQRYQDLFASDAASLQELEVARRRFEVAEAQIRSAEKAVADTSLRAPYSGQVARRLVEVFQSVSARQPVLVLQDVEETLDVIINVPENDVAFRPSNTFDDFVSRTEISAELTAYPELRIPLRFKEFASQADPITRTFQVTFSFDPPDEIRILPGMTAKVFVTPLEDRGFFSIPANAVVANEGQPFVWVIDRATMTVSRRPVGVGEMSGSEMRIVDGLTGGETLAVSAVQNLQDGMEVREIQY